MTINLPNDLERFIRAEVHRGHFASENDAVAEAVRLLQRQLSQELKLMPLPAGAGTQMPDPLLGAMSDAADEMDDIIAETMKHREQQPWRLPST